MDDKNKLTTEEFGASVRYKYPQYSGMSNFDVAQKVLAKYPQYANNISDIPQEKGILRKVGDFFTSSTQKLGTSAGQAFGSSSVIGELSKAEKLNQDTEFRTQQLINKYKSEGKDASNLEQFLSGLKGRGSLQEQISRTIPVVDKSNKQIIGEGIGTGLEALSGGLLKGFKGIGLTKEFAPTAIEASLKKAQFLAQPLKTRLAQIGIETAKNGALLVPFGYASDIASNLEQDKSGASLFAPGLGTTISALLPIGIGAFKAGRQITGDTLGKVVLPNLSGVESGAYERLRTGQPQQFLGKVTPTSVLDDARVSANSFKRTMMDEFGAGKEKIITEFTGKRIGLPDNESTMLKKIAERFGFEDRLPQKMQNMSAKETMDLLAEINNISPIKEIDDPLVKNLKLNLSEIKDSIVNRSKQVFTTAKEGEIGEFEKIYGTYTSRKKVLKNLQSIIGKIGDFKLDPTKQRTAINRLQSVFKENSEGYIDAIKGLGDDIGDNLLDKIAASQLTKVMPKTLRGAPTGVIGVASDLLALLTFPLSSPRVGSYLLRKAGGYDSGIATKLLNASPSIRTAIYNAVNKENMSFNDAVKLYARDVVDNINSIPNKQGGFISTGLTPYKETGDLTTKILKDLEGKTTVSKQYILDATNRGELKQVERDLIREVLATEKGDTINVSDFAKKVKAELLPLKRNTTLGDINSIGVESNAWYENTTLPGDLRGKIQDYSEHIYEGPVKTSAGDIHFTGSYPNYFGHTRIEDMADNKTRRVIELQSDLYQKGNLEKEVALPNRIKRPQIEKEIADLEERIASDGGKFSRESDIRSLNEWKKTLADLNAGRGAEVAKLQQYNDPTAHFRMVREEIKKASQDGKTKLQFPTGETAMKIEGLGAVESNRWTYYDGDGLFATTLEPQHLKVGKTINSGDSLTGDWIITDVLGDGKFKAVPIGHVENEMASGLKKISDGNYYDPSNAEQFDISGKVDTNNPIYKFYEKDVQKYLNKFGGKKVVDDKGVSWIEVPITKEQGDMPVEAFGKIKLNPLMVGAGITGAGAIIANKKANNK